MSKSKFIRVGKEEGLHVYDVLHDVFLKYLIDAANRSPHAQQIWLAEELRSWRVCATIGDIAASFDDGWSGAQRQIVAELATQACDTLAERPSISAEEMRGWNVLNGAGIETRGEIEIPTAPVVEVGRAVTALLRNEEIEQPPGGTWFYSSYGRCAWQR